jgi:hypothetical protein
MSDVVYMYMVINVKRTYTYHVIQTYTHIQQDRNIVTYQYIHVSGCPDVNTKLSVMALILQTDSTKEAKINIDHWHKVIVTHI